MKKGHVGSSQVTSLVVRAGQAFIKAKGKDPEIEGKPLADWLRSGEQIGEMERELLAQLVTGEWRKLKGRPAVKGSGHSNVQDIAKRYRTLQAEYGPRKSLAAKQDTAEEFSVSERTVERRDKEVRALTDAIAKAESSTAK